MSRPTWFIDLIKKTFPGRFRVRRVDESAHHRARSRSCVVRGRRHHLSAERQCHPYRPCHSRPRKPRSPVTDRGSLHRTSGLSLDHELLHLPRCQCMPGLSDLPRLSVSRRSRAGNQPAAWPPGLERGGSGARSPLPRGRPGAPDRPQQAGYRLAGRRTGPQANDHLQLLPVLLPVADAAPDRPGHWSESQSSAGRQRDRHRSLRGLWNLRRADLLRGCDPPGGWSSDDQRCLSRLRPLRRSLPYRRN